MIDVSDRFAEGFLRAGGRLSLAEWMGLTAEAQEAFVAAGDRIRLGLIGEVASVLASAIDGARATAVLEQGIDTAARRLTEGA